MWFFQKLNLMSICSPDAWRISSRILSVFRTQGHEGFKALQYVELLQDLAMSKLRTDLGAMLAELQHFKESQL